MLLSGRQPGAVGRHNTKTASTYRPCVTDVFLLSYSLSFSLAKQNTTHFSAVSKKDNFLCFNTVKFYSPIRRDIVYSGSALR